MKTILLLILIPLLTIQQQKVEIKDGAFYTYVQDGRGKNVNMSFSLPDEVKAKILKSESYATTKRDTSFVAANIKKRGITDTLAVHLFSQVNAATFSTSSKLKSSTSFTIEEGTKGRIYYSGESLVISLPFQGQNGRGNMVHATSITKDGKTLITEN